MKKTIKTRTLKAFAVLRPYSIRRTVAYKDYPVDRVIFNRSIAYGEFTKGEKVVPCTISYETN